jgi:gliding motility-associated-like protein
MKAYRNIFFVVCLLLCITHHGFSQTYAFNNGFANNQTISTCSGTFFDDGINSNYGANQNYTVTFCPASTGKVIQMTFSQINIAAGDSLFVYDGKTTTASVIDTFTNESFTGSTLITVSDTSTTGCLTFMFKSDGATQAGGWIASINCGYQCKQKILGNITTTPSPDANGYINVCLEPNATANFNLNVNYPDSGLIYGQSNSTSFFQWIWGDGKDTSGLNLTSVSHTYFNQGGYNIKVIVRDSNGCINKVPIIAKLRTNIKPIYRINAPTTICVNDTVRLTPLSGSTTTGSGSVVAQLGTFLQLPVSGDSLFLPDGAGVTYTSNLNIQQFPSGTSLTNINNFSVYINMEHSYFGDLDINLIAPNGITVNLATGGGLTYLGEPVDEARSTAPPGWVAPSTPLSKIPGKGYTYIFNNQPTYGTMLSEQNNYTYSFIDNAGRQATNKKYLPAGSYKSASSLSAFVGAPLNGIWKLSIRDRLAIDNGFLFNWYLQFAPSLYPSLETYTVPIVSQGWVTPASGLLNVNGTLATVSPTSAGNYAYTYRVEDGYGCTMDTTVIIAAKAAPQKPNLGADVALCAGQSSLNLTVANPDATAFYTWNNGAVGVATTITSSGTYSVVAANADGCTSRDTIIVTTSNPVTVNLGNDTFYCASKPNLLKPIVSSNVSNYLWSDNSTKDSLRITGPGTYWVQGITSNGCINTDTITVWDNTVNSFVMPLDTIICERTSYILTLSPPPNTSILWNDGVVGNSHIITGPKSYSVIANNIGCLKQVGYNVTTKALPIVNLGLDTTICNSKTYLLKVSYPNASFTWNDNSSDSFYLVKKAGIYWVEGLLNQCTFRDSITINYKKCDCETFIPTAFSPNGDGFNETFYPVMQCKPIGYKLSIFNRYGQRLFETTNTQQAWDGKQNGQSLPVGVYYYILTYYNTGLQLYERFSGNVMILK